MWRKDKGLKAATKALYAARRRAPRGGLIPSWWVAVLLMVKERTRASHN